MHSAVREDVLIILGLLLRHAGYEVKQWPTYRFNLRVCRARVVHSGAEERRSEVKTTRCVLMLAC